MVQGQSPQILNLLPWSRWSEMLYLPNDAGATLKEVIDVDDGTKAYVLASDQEGSADRNGGLWVPRKQPHRVVGADDFLTREVRVGVEGMGGEIGDIVTIRYYNFDEPLVVEPPAEYMENPRRVDGHWNDRCPHGPWPRQEC